LSIVQRLGALLGVKVRVVSNLGRGSTFAIDLRLAEPLLAQPPAGLTAAPHSSADLPSRALAGSVARPGGSILIVEDDPEVRDLLALGLAEAGHRTFTFADGLAALDAVQDGRLAPDLILADYNLPGGMHGLRLAAKVRQTRAAKTPTIILTGDISAETLRGIDAADCVSLHKPVKLAALIAMVDKALATASPLSTAAPTPAALGALATADRWSDAVAAEAHQHSAALIYLVDDDEMVLDLIGALLRQDGFAVETYTDCESFLQAYRPGRHGCLILDARLPGLDGLELLIRLRQTGDPLPVVIITGGGDLTMAVQAMKAGASDFIEKPIGRDDLLASVERALVQSHDSGEAEAWRESAKGHMAALTVRQREIMDRVLAGHPSKNIAVDLGISQRTVENHRAAIMHKTGAKSLPALARLALAAGPVGA
jgi:two-component system CheB/CheR fusion protein